MVSGGGLGRGQLRISLLVLVSRDSVVGAFSVLSYVVTWTVHRRLFVKQLAFQRFDSASCKVVAILRWESLNR